MIATWKAPGADGSQSEELLIFFDQSRDTRLLILPALFDEANKLRRFTVDVMRRLDQAGLDTFLPDMPSCNESLAPMPAQSITAWRKTIIAACEQFNVTHVLTIRGAAVLAPDTLPVLQYAPVETRKQLRAMLKAEVIAARERGEDADSEALATLARAQGISLASFAIGPDMFGELETADIPAGPMISTIAQDQLDGPGLWLRAEPDHAPDQAEALAAIIARQVLAP